MARKKSDKASKSKGAGGGGKVVVVALLAFIAGCAAWLVFKPSKVLVPAVVGLTEARAGELIQASGLTVVTSVKETDLPDQAGKVLLQTPPANSAVPKMSVVTIVIGKGPDGPSLPNLVGKTRSEAEDALLRLALKVQFQEAKSDSVPIGRVISHSPAAGEKVPPKGTVTLVISGGIGDIEVPDLVNMTVEEARAALEALGLALDVAEVATDDFQEGQTAYILRQEPAAGQGTSAGAKVTVFIPIAPPVGGAAPPTGGSASHAPRFEGLTVGAAKKLAAEQGVQLDLADSGDESKTVTFQDPPPGDPLSGDGSVVIRVSDSAVVPSLGGLSEAEARTRLEAAGLSVGQVKKSFGEVPGEVLDQRPSSGIEAVAGSTVDLVVADPGAPASSALAPTPTPGFTPAPWVE